jgi:hypothetical protein
MAITITAVRIKVAEIRHRGQITADRRAKNPVISAGIATAAKRRPIASPLAGPGGPTNISNVAIAIQKATPAHAKALTKGILVGPAMRLALPILV